MLNLVLCYAVKYFGRLHLDPMYEAGVGIGVLTFMFFCISVCVFFSVSVDDAISSNVIK